MTRAPHPQDDPTDRQVGSALAVYLERPALVMVALGFAASLPYYLVFDTLSAWFRAEGLALSWVGTGRLIFSLNYSDQDFAEVADRFVAAAQAMERDGWFWVAEGASGKQVRRRVLRELLVARFA